MPEMELFMIELKGNHMNPNVDTKSSDNLIFDNKHQVYDSRTYEVNDEELIKILHGEGVHKKCKDLSDQISIINSYEIYHFTLTEGTGQRRYLTSLMFFELCLDIRTKRAFFAPMVYTLISSYPVFNVQKQCLITMFKD